MYTSNRINKSVFPKQMKLLAEVAEGLGYKTEWIDRWAGYLLRIRGKLFGYGYFPRFPLNSAEARALCKDKALAYMILEKKGYCVPEGDYFIKYDERYLDNCRGKSEKEAIAYAGRIGFPVFVKPNRMAMGVNCKLIADKKDLKKQIAEIFAEDYIVLIQKFLSGREYRVVWLDEEVILAYEKKLPEIIGDRRNTVEKLAEDLAGKNSKLQVDWDLADRKGFGKKSILKKGAKLLLRDNANLSTGGMIGDVLKKAPGDLEKYVKRLAKDLDLRLGGLDLMVDDINDAGTYTIIEVNADPGFDQFMNFDRQKTLEVLEKILKRCFKL